MPSSSKKGLQGPRPQPLKVPRSSPSSKRPRGAVVPAPTGNSSAEGRPPVIVYEHTPRIVHARPQEFMTVVQQLTGKPAAASASPPTDSPEIGAGRGGDPLLLTLGQCPAAAASSVPSPIAAGLLSPGFLFSPNTVQAFRELSPLF